MLALAGAGTAGYMYRAELADLARGGGPVGLSAEVATPKGRAPTPSETVSPAIGPSPKPKPDPKGRLLIHGTGDVNLDPSYIPDLAANGYGYAWSGVDGLFRRDDLTVVNLECAISTRGSPLAKEFTFRGPPESLPPMAEAGVEVANLGNNHAYDFGPEALLDSRKHLRQAGIAPVGAGKDQDQALRPAVLEVKGWRVAVVGLDMVVDPYPEALATEDKPGTSAGHDTALMLRAIRAAERRDDPLGGGARHAAQSGPGGAGTALRGGRRRRHLRASCPPSPADGRVSRPPDLLGARQLRVAELLGGRVHHGRRPGPGPEERHAGGTASPGVYPGPRPPGPADLTPPHAAQAPVR